MAERLRVERDIDPAARSARIPAMLLQTLVENAIKHGIATLKEGGTLQDRGAGRGKRSWCCRSTIRGRWTLLLRPLEGVGLRNSAERLRLLFGARASCALDLSQAGLATAEVRLPL